MIMSRRFFRRSSDAVIGGVCGGLGKYTDTDPVMWRLGTVLAFFFSFSVIGLIYLITWIVVPEEE